MDSLSILIISSTASDTGVRVAKALADTGCNVTVLCSSVHVSRAVPNLRIVSIQRWKNFRSSMLHALQVTQPAVVIPCDDGSAEELHAIHATHPEWRTLIHKSLGDPAAFAPLDSRAGLLHALSQTPDVDLPKWHIIDSHRAFNNWLAARDFTNPWVLKQEATGGGTGVRIVRQRAGAESAHAELVRRRRLVIRAKRMIIDLLFGLNTYRFAKPRQQMVAQQYIDGRAANVAMFCHNGEVLSSIEVEVLSRFSEVSPSAAVRRIQHAGMHAAAVAVARQLGLSGFHGLDFILQQGTDRAYLLELNPRVTPTAHFAFDADHDLIAAAARAWSFVYQERTFHSDTVALFPRQILVDPSSVYLKTAHVDTPIDSPELTARLMQRATNKDIYGYVTHGLHRLGKYLRARPRVTEPSF
jgi:hypothetical protein